MFIRTRIALLVVSAAIMLSGVGRADNASTEEVKNETSSEVSDVTLDPASAKVGERAKVVVIPVQDQIAEPVFYVIRRGLKEAIDSGAEVVLLDMRTPGGAMNTTLEIMEALSKFPGTTITYVNPEAISAGALIAGATDEIWFAPQGRMGAAAPVLATGGEIDGAMKQKILSYMKATVRASAEGKGSRYRGEVISAMIDGEKELKIAGKVIKPAGELLTLTATEACTYYGKGKNRSRLLGDGIAEDIETLLKAKYGENGYVIQKLEVTWSETLASYLNAIGPILMGLGLVFLIIEFKTPGFGIFGVAGIILMALFFLGNKVAGLSGYEPALVFALGLALVLLELLVFPGIVMAAVTGVLMMLGALVWSMADVWPNEGFEFSADMLIGPLSSVALGLVIAAVIMFLLVRFLPRGWIWGRLVLDGAIDGSSQEVMVKELKEGKKDIVGKEGLAVSALMPAGQVEIEGRYYEASVEVGSIAKGERVVVRGAGDFRLLVEPVSAKPAGQDNKEAAQ